jgi:hypothetical protein
VRGCDHPRCDEGLHLPGCELAREMRREDELAQLWAVIQNLVERVALLEQQLGVQGP